MDIWVYFYRKQSAELWKYWDWKLFICD